MIPLLVYKSTKQIYVTIKKGIGDHEIKAKIYTKTYLETQAIKREVKLTLIDRKLGFFCSPVLKLTVMG